MNPQQVIIAWSLALCGNLLFFSAAHHPFQLQMAGKPIAVVGTSLVAYGLPDEDTITGSLLSDGRKHVRVGLANPTELEILQLGNQALEQNAELIFIEASPFVRSFSHKADRDPGCNFSIKQIKVGANSMVNRLFSSAQVTALSIMGKYRNQARDQAIRPTELELGKVQDSLPNTDLYPLRPHPVLCPDHLRTFLFAANAKNTQVILILPPRSSYGEKFAGLGSSPALALQAREMAKAYGLELFSPTGPWPNALFVDSGHMNRRGRARLLSELQNWWQGRT